MSRVEVATKFFSPPPETMLRELVGRGDIAAEQAELAKHLPVARDFTAEADSGGHTDNRPLVALVPTLLALRDRMQVHFPPVTHEGLISAAGRGGRRHRRLRRASPRHLLAPPMC